MAAEGRERPTLQTVLHLALSQSLLALPFVGTEWNHVFDWTSPQISPSSTSTIVSNGISLHRGMAMMNFSLATGTAVVRGPKSGLFTDARLK